MLLLLLSLVDMGQVSHSGKMGSEFLFFEDSGHWVLKLSQSFTSCQTANKFGLLQYIIVAPILSIYMLDIFNAHGIISNINKLNFIFLDLFIEL